MTYYHPFADGMSLDASTPALCTLTFFTVLGLLLAWAGTHSKTRLP